MLLFFLNFFQDALAQPNPPSTLFLDKDLLAVSRNKIEQNDKNLAPSFKTLIKEANKYLDEGPFSVMDKQKTPPDGDKHDYFSLSIYAWPNPKTADSLPYITRDGEVNPQSKIGTDEESFVKMCESSFTLALAYYFSGNEKYAEHASDIIRTWFIDSKTKMNPNLNYAQTVMGKNEGSPGGIIDGRNLVYVTEAAGLLTGSTSWRDEDMEDLKSWFKDYLNWLLTSKNGIEEGNSKNNHVTFYKAQVVD